jgi:asparagine synthase (glutamine-hydrolysing)
MDDLVPREILARTDKIGFEPPQLNWMEQPAVQVRIAEAKSTLVKEKILKEKVLNKKIQPHNAYTAESYDWRYLVAATVM